jgi:hypothetical protein
VLGEIGCFWVKSRGLVGFGTETAAVISGDVVFACVG